MKLADAIRNHTREKYVLPARAKRVSRFTIRPGDVVRELGIGGHRAPAVCSALKTQRFLKDNRLRLIEATRPKSGQSRTVTYTYEFVGDARPKQEDAWTSLRGALKDIFQAMGGGEAYLHSERSHFRAPRDVK